MAEVTTTNIEQIQAVYAAQVAQEAKATALRMALQALQPAISMEHLDYRGLLTALQSAIAAELAQQDTSAPEEGATDGPQ